MELNFSHKGLTSFDASSLGCAVEKQLPAPSSTSGDSVLHGLLSRAPVIRAINLSHNSIRGLVGTETLRFVTFLDLSHNSLTTLSASCLPPALTKLHLMYNSLCDVSKIGQFAPDLQELDISFNAFTTEGLRDLPASLVSLTARGNDIDDLGVFGTLLRLSRLDVSRNALSERESLQVLGRLQCLHHVDLRENAVMEVPSIAAHVVELAPRLMELNGEPLSQAINNRQVKAAKVVEASRVTSQNTSLTMRAERNGQRGSSQQRQPSSIAKARSSENSIFSASRLTASRLRAPAPPMEIRLMEAKVTELRRLLADGEKKESQSRYNRGVLVDQIKSCASVIERQAREMDELQSEIESLLKEEQQLREPVAQLDHTFEQTHASLIAQKVDSLGVPHPT